VTAAEEWARIGPVIAGLRDCGVPLSVDTRHADTMRRAIDAGAGMINDVTALRGDADSLKAVAGCAVPVCLMHMQGDPGTMQDNPHYNNVMQELLTFFEERIAVCEAAGIARALIVIEPGIGFGKRLDHNLEILRNIPLLCDLGHPVLIGVSRKRFIGELCRVPDPALREPGTIAASLQAVAKGATIVRVHDAAGMRQALTVFRAVH
jgi:dihydropteroate synthase